MTRMPKAGKKKCHECGIEYEYDGRSDPRRGSNPYWCPSCDRIRIERITKQLEALVASFSTPTESGQLPDEEA